MPLNDNVSAIITLFPHLKKTEFRQDQEEGGELDSNKEASPEETKSREVVLGLELDFFCFSCFPTAELRTLSL